jgi:TolB-like protein
MPFTTASGDPEQEYRDGIVEDIITAAWIKWLHVICNRLTYKAGGRFEAGRP